MSCLIGQDFLKDSCFEISFAFWNEFQIDETIARLKIPSGSPLVDQSMADAEIEKKYTRSGKKLVSHMYCTDVFELDLTCQEELKQMEEKSTQSIDITEITRAARYGRQIGSCHTMDCDFLNGQIRSVGEYLGSFEEFLSSIFESLLITNTI